MSSIRVLLLLGLFMIGCVSAPREGEQPPPVLSIQAAALQRVLEGFGSMSSVICISVLDEYSHRPISPKDPPREILERFQAPGQSIYPQSECEWVSSPRTLLGGRQLVHRESGQRAQQLWVSTLRRVGDEVRVWAGVYFGIEAARGYECGFAENHGRWEFTRYYRVWMSD